MTDEKLLELLAEHSHIAQMQKKQQHGYADHPWPTDWKEGIKHSDTCSIPVHNHHFDMIPYSELSEIIKEYYRVIVLGVIDGIRDAGYKIVKE